MGEVIKKTLGNIMSDGPKSATGKVLNKTKGSGLGKLKSIVNKIASEKKPNVKG